VERDARADDAAADDDDTGLGREIATGRGFPDIRGRTFQHRDRSLIVRVTPSVDSDDGLISGSAYATLRRARIAVTRVGGTGARARVRPLRLLIVVLVGLLLGIGAFLILNAVVQRRLVFATHDDELGTAARATGFKVHGVSRRT
jgi:hypothetical protein